MEEMDALLLAEDGSASFLPAPSLTQQQPEEEGGSGGNGDIMYLCPRTHDGFQTWDKMSVHLMNQRVTVA